MVQIWIKAPLGWYWAYLPKQVALDLINSPDFEFAWTKPEEA